MVFRRRDRRSPFRVVAELLWPRGGWGRAFLYVKHRIRRLPDTPERIARGIGTGVFTTFTPFYGMHFIVAALMARIFNGNILASLSATFFGNPLTYVPIGVVSLQTGHWILGIQTDPNVDDTLVGMFLAAGSDLWYNVYAFVIGAPTDWTGLLAFFHEVFYPYLIGGVIPGIICGSVAYVLSVPLIRAYQQRRKAKIKAKFEAIKKRAELEAVNSPHPPKGLPPTESDADASAADRARSDKASARRGD